MAEGTDKLIKRLLEDKVNFTFLSNNSQRSRAEAEAKLKKLGIEVSEEHIYTSGMATAVFPARRQQCEPYRHSGYRDRIGRSDTKDVFRGGY